MHDPRVGRFFAVDPIDHRYPFYSPYQFSSNTPIHTIEFEGLESQNIINESEKYLGTPYEFGGKRPHESMIGFTNKPGNREKWLKWVPYLKKLSINGVYKQLKNIKFDTNLGRKRTHKQKRADRKAANKFKYGLINSYRQFMYSYLGMDNISGSGFSIGIDCSGLTYSAYKQDKDMLMDYLPGGSKNQFNHMLNAQKENKAYVHKNFNLITKGDLIYHPGHVMIATGRVKVDENGIVTEFETLEAHSTGKGVIRQWRKAGARRGQVIGHPHRETDVLLESFVGPLPEGTKRESEVAPIPYASGYNEDRTKNNLEQEIVKDEKPK